MNIPPPPPPPAQPMTTATTPTTFTFARCPAPAHGDLPLSMINSGRDGAHAGASSPSSTAWMSQPPLQTPQTTTPPPTTPAGPPQRLPPGHRWRDIGKQPSKT
ncbi:hypothetical protein DFJ73DRAFT_772276 [Zopfochytrium polystomum]|nr:hypothetical protein DFJ73DRAFT_772276 [Zopfochytrium polystomum]